MSQNPSWNNESNLVIILLNIFLPLQFEVPAALLWPYKMYLLEDFWQNCHSWTLFLQLGSLTFTIKNYCSLKSFIHTSHFPRFLPCVPVPGIVPWQQGQLLAHRILQGCWLPSTLSLITAPSCNSLSAWAGFWPPHTLWTMLFVFLCLSVPLPG